MVSLKRPSERLYILSLRKRKLTICSKKWLVLNKLPGNQLEEKLQGSNLLLRLLRIAPTTERKKPHRYRLVLL
ncbi:hypothetical protein Leryth_025375 [Lithospermum erythrorhizon]|nr:hypothetical protein Leryth_025375 [Lithospermum erythrorhizon]